VSRNGFKILDSDTHVYEPSELLEQYLSAKWKKALEACQPPMLKIPIRGGLHMYGLGSRKTGQRRLGTREQAASPASSTTGNAGAGVPWGVHWKGPPWPSEQVNRNPHSRVQDMDIEGVDVHVIYPTRGVNGFADVEDAGLELAMYEAYHRYIADYCAPYPKRLKSVILASTREIERSVLEITRCAREGWPVALFPITPPGYPLDDPALDPLWTSAVANDLAVIVHPFNLSNPLSPGLDDMWDNVFLERAAGGVFAGMRAMAAVIGSGMLDRFPELRMGLVETGHGWLASWAFHVDEVAAMASYAIQPLRQKPSEYVRGPQYYQSIELHEGEGVLKSTIELLGPDVLMFATDYPHTECWFPKSVETVLGWSSIPDDAKRKLLWDNGVKLYRRCEGL
jgi:uncharacterized protein